MKMSKETLLKLMIILAALLSLTLSGVLGFELCSKKSKVRIVHVNFENIELTDSETWTYSFLNKEISNYIENLAKELDLDADLVVAIIMRENPEFNPDAENRNENGTRDLGFCQLNDRYIWSVFVPAYWDMDIEFNPFNWKHNIFLAMHHIQSLQQSLKVNDDVIAAYNCGLGTVMNRKIPKSTYSYVAAVNNNLKLLKQGEK